MRCQMCRAEVFPRERRCGHCGGELAGATRGQAPLLEASWRLRLLAFGVDLVTLAVFAPLSQEVFPWAGAPVLFAFAYFVLLESGGHQTLGQHVTRSIVLRDNWSTLAWRQAVGRLLAFGVSFPSLLWSRRPWWDRVSGSRLWQAPEL